MAAIPIPTYDPITGLNFYGEGPPDGIDVLSPGGGAPRQRGDSVSTRIIYRKRTRRESRTEFAKWLRSLSPARRAEYYRRMGPLSKQSGAEKYTQAFRMSGGAVGYYITGQPAGGLFDIMFGDKWYEFWRNAAIFTLGLGAGFGVGYLATSAGAVVGDLVAASYGAFAGTLAQIGTSFAVGWVARQASYYVFSPAGTQFIEASYETMDPSAGGDWFVWGGYFGATLGGAYYVKSVVERELDKYQGLAWQAWQKLKPVIRDAAELVFPVPFKLYRGWQGAQGVWDWIRLSPFVSEYGRTMSAWPPIGGF